MVFGTFDGLHKGHRNFLHQAKNLGSRSFLVVSIARDKNVTRIKGQPPLLSEKKRMALVKKTNIADRVILSGVKNYLPHILKEKPDIIALGYDQTAYVKNLKKDLKNKGFMAKVVRLRPYKATTYKNHLLKSKSRI